MRKEEESGREVRERGAGSKREKEGGNPGLVIRGLAQ